MSEVTEDPDSRLTTPRLLSIPELSLSKPLATVADPEAVASAEETLASAESARVIAAETPAPELSGPSVESVSVSTEPKRQRGWNSRLRLWLSRRNHQIGIALVATVLIGLGTLPFLGSPETDDSDTVASADSAEHMLPAPLRASPRGDGGGPVSGAWEPVAGNSNAMQMELDPGVLVHSEHQPRIQPAVHVTELESVRDGVPQARIDQVSGTPAAPRRPGTAAWLTGTIEFEAASVSSPTVHYVRP